MTKASSILLYISSCFFELFYQVCSHFNFG